MDGHEGLGEEGFSIFVLAVEFFVVSLTTSMSCVLSDAERQAFSTFPEPFTESVAGGSAVMCSS